MGCRGPAQMELSTGITAGHKATQSFCCATGCPGTPTAHGFASPRNIFSTASRDEHHLETSLSGRVSCLTLSTVCPAASGLLHGLFPPLGNQMLERGECAWKGMMWRLP